MADFLTPRTNVFATIVHWLIAYSGVIFLVLAIVFVLWIIIEFVGYYIISFQQSRLVGFSPDVRHYEAELSRNPIRAIFVSGRRGVAGHEYDRARNR